MGKGSNRMNDSNSIKLFPGRKKISFLLSVSLLFTVGGIWLIHEGQYFTGLFCSAFFSLGIIVAIIQIIPNGSYLVLRNEGFEVCSLFKKYFEEWKNINEFGVITINSNDMIGYNYTPGYGKKGVVGKMSKGLTGFEAALPDTYGLKAPELLLLMEKYRAKAIDERS